MAAVKRRPLEVASRRVVQDARLAIRDVYDAIVELVTNADDRYQILKTQGRVEIELGRQGKGRPSILRVRDFADGMTTDQMNRKLGRIGGRVSGLEEGHAVRGTNSRGAKDIAALGKVAFDSIAHDGRLHACRIFPNLEYEADDAREVTPKVRKRMGIREGTGTVVTIEIEPSHRIPKIDTLVPNVARLVRLRDIVGQKQTTLVARGLKQGQDRVVSLHRPVGKRRVSQKFRVPGYRGATAKLVIFRARKRFQSARDRFRLGGILVKSRHAIHEATLFDRSLEWDAHAQWFYGRLTCEAIDDLWNEYDERQARGESHPPENPVPILDPSRKSGLIPDHPFVEALYGRALTLLRPLVEEERTREQRERARSVESQRTRKRLDALERAANQFMEDFSDEETSRDPKSRERGSRFQIRGYSLSPQYAQVVCEQSFKCWLTVRSEAFPEIGEGRARGGGVSDRRHQGGASLGASGIGRGAGGRVEGDLVGQGARCDRRNGSGGARRSHQGRIDDRGARLGGREVPSRHRPAVRTPPLQHSWRCPEGHPTARPRGARPLSRSRVRSGAVLGRLPDLGGPEG